ncbi:HmuY family protein [Galbibacter orientalis]|uniref:HmuY family protein n=1 Tax=Galbibacter orientalis TaxID=453852 RepID=UPI003002479B
MKNKFLILNLFVLFILASCSDDDTKTTQEFVVAFENPSVSLTTEEETKEVKLVFSRNAAENGTATITYTTVNAEYDTHFTTNPASEEGTITVPVTAGSNSATFTLNKLQNPIEGTEMSVTFKLASISNPESSIQGNTSLAVSFTESAALGGVLSPDWGGSTYPNQVFIDLSSQKMTPIKRDTWELAFYSGSENRVFLNPALRVSAAELTQFTDINAVTSSTVFDPPLVINSFDLFTQSFKEVTVNSVEEYKVGVKVSYSMYEPYVDTSTGELEGTAISEIAVNDEENKVYLVYMGTEIEDTPAEPGKINTGSVDRGWYKIRVTMEGDSYKLKYAPLDATDYSEVLISKTPQYNSTAFSLTNNKALSVEPAKAEWDLNFSGVFATEIGTTYSDFVLHNTLGGTGVYEVVIEDGIKSYEDFTMSDVIEDSLVFDKKNIIGSGWRSTTGPSSSTPVAKNDRYYVLKDPDGNYYKIRFTALLSESGERGYPKFEYNLL